ncbi:MAG TPA: hypothetical protein VGV35_04205, partial [Bryobacteraceae bacterium]|nr:hypothetical protein [Bryobacteraceae bacterium]
DVFIHTNQDTPANMDSTKLQRVAVIGAASGYFLAAAGPNEVKKLAGEVFARGGARRSTALSKALAETDLQEAYNDVEQAGQAERAALASIATLAPESRPLLDDLVSKSASRQSDLLATLAVLRGNYVHPEPDLIGRLAPTRNPKVVGNLEVYYYDYLKDHLPFVPDHQLDSTLAYEALNLADGHRTIAEIRNILSANYSKVTAQAVYDYFKILEKAEVVKLGRP